jgi:hypothetical protein
MASIAVGGIDYRKAARIDVAGLDKSEQRIHRTGNGFVWEKYFAIFETAVRKLPNPREELFHSGMEMDEFLMQSLLGSIYQKTIHDDTFQFTIWLSVLHFSVCCLQPARVGYSRFRDLIDSQS